VATRRHLEERELSDPEEVEAALRNPAKAAGRVEPHPEDPEKCRLCDYRDVCRFVIAAPALAEGVSSWD